MPPIYDYECPSCLKNWDVTKRMSESQTPEKCPACDTVGMKLPSLFRVDSESAGDWNRPHFSPALGQVVKGNKEARRLAKSRGMEEIGTEPPENLHKSAEKTQEERRAQRWADAERDKVYD